MSDPIVGIDLGTSNSVVAICDETGLPRVLTNQAGVKVHPSVVSFHPNGTVIVGADAKQRKVLDPRNTVYSVKRLIGRGYNSPQVQTAVSRMPFTIIEGEKQQPIVKTRAGEFSVPEISAIVLDHMHTMTTQSLGYDVSQAVITVPANFTDAQRSATATAGAIAGLTVVRVLNEPTAAALAYGHQRQLNKVIAVYDFGGGTFDVTILRLRDQVYEVLGTSGDSFLGGDDIDETVVDQLVASFLAQHRIDLRQNEVSMMRLRAVAEQTKIELSRRNKAVIRVDEIAYGPGGAPINLNFEITRDELVRRVADIVEKTFPVCNEALRTANISAADIEDVVLVGGTTKMPYVRDRVTQFFGRPPRTDVNPEEAVAVGAALQAQALGRVLGRSSVAIPAVQFPGPGPGSADDFIESSTRDDVAAMPTGPSPRSRGLTERPVTRGESVDRLIPVTSPSGGGAAIGRITRTPVKPMNAIHAAAPIRTPVAPTQDAFDPGAVVPIELDGDDAIELATFDPSDVIEYEEQIVEQDPVAARTTAPMPAELRQPAQQPRMGVPMVQDVTPRSLGISTISGYCKVLIPRNAKLPAHHVESFTTSRDGQQVVRLSFCQGESRRLDENVVLGDVVLENLPSRPRGDTTIQVVFALDVSGILTVQARDAQTGQEQRVSLDVIGAMPAAAVDDARARIAALHR